MVMAEQPQFTWKCNTNPLGVVAGNIVSSVTRWTGQVLALVQIVDDGPAQITSAIDARLEEGANLIYQSLVQVDVQSNILSAESNQLAMTESTTIIFDTTWLIASISTSFSQADDTQHTRSISHSDEIGTQNNIKLPSQQQPEYDEGIRCFPRLLSIDCDVMFGQSASTKLTSRSKPMSIVAVETSSLSVPNDVSYHHLASILMYNLGQIRNRQKRYNEAYVCFIESYRLIANSPELVLASAMVVRILHNLGYIQYRNGNVIPSLHLFQTALTVHESSINAVVLSTELATTTAYMAATLNCLGVLYFHIPTRIEYSTEYLSKSLSLQQQYLVCSIGSNHSKHCTGMIPIISLIASTLNNVGRLHFMNGNAELAIEVSTESLELRRQLLGNDHLDVAATAFNLGHAHYEIREYDSALTYCQEFLRITKPQLSLRHRDVAYMLKCVAHIHHQRKNYSNAIATYHEALIASESVFGIDAEVSSIYNKLGNLYYSIDEYDSALSMYECGLKIENVVFQPYHLNIAITLCNIAQIHKAKGNTVQALSLYEQVYNIQVSSVGCCDPIVAVTLSNIAFLQFQCDQYKEAYETYQEVLQIRMVAFGGNSIHNAATLNSMGLVLCRLGDLESSLQHFIRSYQIRHSELGDGHNDVAITLKNIGTMLLVTGKDDMAIRIFREALRVEHKIFGLDHENTIPSLLNLAKLQKRNGEINDAVKYLGEVLRLQWQVHTANKIDPQHNNIASGRITVTEEAMMKTLYHLAKLQLQIGNTGGYVDTMSDVWRLSKLQQQSPSSDDEDDIIQRSMLHLHWNNASYHYTDNDDEEVIVDDDDDDSSVVVTTIVNETLSITRSSSSKTRVSPINLYILSKLHPEAAPMA